MNRYYWRRWLLAPILDVLYNLEFLMAKNNDALDALTRALADQKTAIDAVIAEVQQLVANGNDNDDVSGQLTALAATVAATTQALLAVAPAPAPAPVEAAPAA